MPCCYVNTGGLGIMKLLLLLLLLLLCVCVQWFTLKFIVYALVYGHADSIQSIAKNSTFPLQYESSITKMKKNKTTIAAWKVGIKWTRTRYFQVLKQFGPKTDHLNVLNGRAFAFHTFICFCAIFPHACSRCSAIIMYLCARFFLSLSRLPPFFRHLLCDTMAQTIYCHD